MIRAITKMNTCMALAAAAVITPFLQPAYAQAPTSGVRAFVGYKALDLDDHRFSHDTHPDDSFLPDYDIPGSAGTTAVGGRLHFVALGGGYQARLADVVSLTIDLGGLIGGARDRRQNANDTRPQDKGSFVYSQARFGLFAAAGLSYHIQRFYGGVQVQLAGVFVESGWDRFDKDDSQHTKFDLSHSVGPKVGYVVTRNARLEGSVLFGHGATPGVRAVWKF